MKDIFCPYCDSVYTRDVSDYYKYDKKDHRTKRFCLTCTNSFYIGKEKVKSIFTKDKPVSVLEVESYSLGKSAIHIILKNNEADDKEKVISVISRDLISITKVFTDTADILLRLMIYVGGPSEDDQFKLRFDNEDLAQEFINGCNTHILKVFWNNGQD